MKASKIIAVTVLAIISIALAGVSIYAYALAGNAATTYQPNTASGYYTNGMMSGNLGGMMGGNGMMGNYSNGYSTAPSPTPNSVPQRSTLFPLVGLAALIGAVATGTGGAAYLLSRPKMRAVEYAAANIVESITYRNVLAPYVSVSKTLTSEERKVFDVLVSHDGKYLQKYIRAETGLSRLKTHRIVSRLAERGIVTLEKSGNTNEVHLSSWLQNSNIPEQNLGKQMKNTKISE